MIIVIQSGTKCSEDELLSKGEKSREHPLDVFVCITEILPPYGRLNDKLE